MVVTVITEYMLLPSTTHQIQQPSYAMLLFIRQRGYERRCFFTPPTPLITLRYIAMLPPGVVSALMLAPDTADAMLFFITLLKMATLH